MSIHSAIFVACRFSEESLKSGFIIGGYSTSGGTVNG